MVIRYLMPATFFGQLGVMSEARVVVAWLADFLIRLYRSMGADLDSDLGLMARCVCFGLY